MVRRFVPLYLAVFPRPVDVIADVIPALSRLLAQHVVREGHPAALRHGPDLVQAVAVKRGELVQPGLPGFRGEVECLTRVAVGYEELSAGERGRQAHHDGPDEQSRVDWSVGVRLEKVALSCTRNPQLRRPG